MFLYIFVFILLICSPILPTNSQSGPDPWNYESKSPKSIDEYNTPADIRMPPKTKSSSENKLGLGEWFFRRTLAVVLRGGNMKTNEDGSVDISLQMNFDPKRWELLDQAMNSDSPLSEDMLRKSVAYVEESIYKPSIAKQIVLSWSEYIQYYLTEYKTYITWTLCSLAVAGGTMWLWTHMSHRHAIVVLFLIFYAYEVVISYKEAEQIELDKFVSAVSRCNWYFWTSSCDVPPPDPLVFMKHMNPMKIGIRMFTTALAEPFIVISSTVDTILHRVTDGLWYPLDKIMFGVLVVFINISLIFLLVMILFNWVLNIRFGLSFFGVGVSIKSKQSTPVFQNLTEMQPRSRIEQADGISQATLDKILNVCSLALSNNTPAAQQPAFPASTQECVNNVTKLRRSASTGRLPNNSSFGVENLALDNTVRRRNIRPSDGSGDA